MTMQDWINRLDYQLQSIGRPLLEGYGSIKHEQAIRKAEEEFRKYREKEMKELKDLEDSEGDSKSHGKKSAE